MEQHQRAIGDQLYKMDQLLCQQRSHFYSACSSGAHGLGSAPGWLIPPPQAGRGCQPGATSPTSPSILSETHTFSSAMNATSFHHLVVNALNTLTRSIPGECNLYRSQCPSPIQGSFDLRPLGHYLFFSFLCLLRANLALLLITPRQYPLFGFPTPKPGNAPSQPR
jgi:hypothetical protein